MAEKTFKSRIVQKHDTETNWAKATNFVPLKGELIIYDPDSTYSYGRFKIGDGVTTVNLLPFVVDEVVIDNIESTLNTKLDENNGEATGTLKVGTVNSSGTFESHASIEGSTGYVNSTWLRTSSASELGSTPADVAVLSGGWIYKRSLSNMKNDLGVPTKTSQLTNDSVFATETYVDNKVTGYANQNAFSNIKVGTTTIVADTTTDTLELAAGSNITLTSDANNDKVTIAAKDTTYSAATTSAAGLMSAADKTKLDGIATGANKYTYTLPVATSSALGGIKSGTDITVDSSGNVSVNDNSHAHTIANVTDLQTSLNGKVPTSRTVNGKALSANITLSAADVGADASGSASSALTSAKSYTDTKVANLVNSAPEALNTLGELATALQEHEDAYDALLETVGGKAEGTHEHSATDITSGTLSSSRLSTSGVTAGSYGDDEATRTLDFSGKFDVPYVTVDNKGRVTGASTKTLTLPANIDTKVTSVGNHYTPSTDSSAALSVDASSTTAATWGTTNLVTGVNLQRDAKGHVTGMTVDSIKMPSNPNSNTWRPVQINSAAIGSSETLNIQAGTNVTIAENGGVVTISSTDTNTDTKNTAGSTDSSSKLYLVGATSQAANPQTYSHDTAYVGTDGCLYSGGTKVSVEGHTHSYASSTHNHDSTYVNTSGDTMTGTLVAQNNANYTTKQVRNIFLVAEGSTLPTGANGDICLVYTP